jgi:hypothetical protein
MQENRAAANSCRHRERTTSAGLHQQTISIHKHPLQCCTTSSWRATWQLYKAGETLQRPSENVKKAKASPYFTAGCVVSHRNSVPGNITMLPHDLAFTGTVLPAKSQQRTWNNGPQCPISDTRKVARSTTNIVALKPPAMITAPPFELLGTEDPATFSDVSGD